MNREEMIERYIELSTELENLKNLMTKQDIDIANVAIKKEKMKYAVLI